MANILSKIKATFSSKNKLNADGFTIIEVLIVIAIIGILASLTLRGTMGSTDKAKIGRAKSEISQILRIIQQIEVDTGCWPKSPDEATCKVPYVIESGAGGNEIWDLSALDVGIIGNTDNAFPNWRGPYMAIVHKDPWGNDYFFDTDYDIDPTGIVHEAVVIGSFGPNGVGPNIYDDDDVIYIIVE